MGPKKVPYLITHDARTLRYPNPHIKANDTVQVDIATGKIQEHIKFDTGCFYSAKFLDEYLINDVFSSFQVTL